MALSDADQRLVDRSGYRLWHLQRTARDRSIIEELLEAARAEERAKAEARIADEIKASLALKASLLSLNRTLGDESMARSSAEARIAELTQEGVGKRIREVVAERDGFWRTCSGCCEMEDGQNIHGYPHSAAFDCVLGSGCGECGGIGATWDTTDYDAMADEMMAEDDALSRATQAEELVREVVGVIEDLLRQDIRARENARSFLAKLKAAPLQGAGS